MTQNEKFEKVLTGDIDWKTLEHGELADFQRWAIANGHHPNIKPKPEPKPKSKPKGFHVEIKNTAEAVKKGVPPVKWFVPDLIPEGLTLLAGDAKVGKTFFALNVGLALAQGGMALGEKKVDKPYNVCYMALDDSERRIISRVEKLCPEGVPTNFHHIDHFPYKFTEPFMKQLAPFLQEIDTQFLIVDTWQKVNPPPLQKGTSYEVEYAAVSSVKEFFQSIGISLMIITHTNKTKSEDHTNIFQKIQGSTGMQGGCDSMLLLDKGERGLTLHTNGNDVADDDFAMEFDKTSFHWYIAGEAQEVFRSDARQEYLDLLRKAGAKGMKQMDIAAKTGKSTAAVGKTLKLMANEGLVIRPKEKGKWYANDDGIGF